MNCVFFLKITSLNSLSNQPVRWGHCSTDMGGPDNLHGPRLLTAQGHCSQWGAVIKVTFLLITSVKANLSQAVIYRLLEITL